MDECYALSNFPLGQFLRKLGLYRFLNGNAGVQVDEPEQAVDAPKSTKSTLLQPPKKKKSIKSKKTKKQSAPLSILTVEFVLRLLASFDTLIASSVGTNMQFEDQGKVIQQDLIPKASKFVEKFLQTLLRRAAGGDDEKEEKLAKFIAGILGGGALLRLRPRMSVLILTAVKNGLGNIDTKINSPLIPIEESVIEDTISCASILFSSGSIVVTFRDAILDSFATILSHSRLGGTVSPKLLLKVLSLFPLDLGETSGHALLQRSSFLSMQKWVSQHSAETMAAACASAFVNGDLFERTNDWDPIRGSTQLERSWGASIVLLAALSSSSAPSELLWPAIHKGLSSCPSATVNWHKADKASRATILLEFGCKLELLSGMGNGDLVVDKQTQQMMPPPPTVESLLSNGTSFILNHVRSLTSARKQQESTPKTGVSGSARSGNAARTSAMIATLVNQLKVLNEGFPSSMVITSAADEILKSSLNSLVVNKPDDIDAVTFSSLAFAALSSGADPLLQIEGLSSGDIVSRLLKLSFSGNSASLSKAERQAFRSVFHYARWGTVSFLLPKLLEKADFGDSTMSLMNEVFETANDVVEATPIDAMLPLFESVKITASSWLVSRTNSNTYGRQLSKIIQALLSMENEVSNSMTKSYMLNQTCALIFQPHLVLDEWMRLEDDPDYDAPIKLAFRTLMKKAGTARPFISRATLCHICAAWLGFSPQEAGQGAIPYRTAIAKLLVHKETTSTESSTNQSELTKTKQSSDDALELPVETSDTSVARGFLLVFLSKLPSLEDGLDRRVLVDLLHYMIIKLLDDICLAPLTCGAMLMTGNKDYTVRIRAWQALCLLARFVTSDIIAKVSERLYKCFGQNLHGQIRYFLEIFAIQIARQHPTYFVNIFVREIQLCNLTLQHIASLMITGGNLIVGRYKLDFFRDYEGSKLELRRVLSGVIPWLSSTQGFSRALAQLLVHELIPLVIDVSKEVTEGMEDWFLYNLFSFLDKNQEMKRLRKKQVKTFERYDADKVCTVEGLLSIDTDESDEANPVHVVDAIKKCLEEVYLEAHENEGPVWRQVDQMMRAELDDVAVDQSSGVNFQRKIIPLDSLDLAIEQSREQRFRNVSGRKKQKLIVCAALIEKIPNLGGLARTSEIFAAEKLVIPDKNVCRMDNFKSISVGAGDWIEIEECKEDVSRKLYVLHLPNDYCHITKICSEHIMKILTPIYDGRYHLS